MLRGADPEFTWNMALELLCTLPAARAAVGEGSCNALNPRAALMCLTVRHSLLAVASVR